MTRISDLEPTIAPALEDVMVVSDGVITKKITLDNLKDLIVNPAGANSLGSIKVGNGLEINNTGVLSVRNYQAYTLPPATANTLGGIRVGSGLSIDADILSLNLPIASNTTLGGFKTSSDVSVNLSGVLTVNFPDHTVYDDTGLQIGNDLDLKIFVDGEQSPTLFNQVGGSLSFQVTDDGTNPQCHFISGERSASFGGGSPNIPAFIRDFNEAVNLGSPLYKWNTVYTTNLSATNFLGTINGDINGTAENANKLLLSGNYVIATVASTPSTIVGRDASGNITANAFIGNITGIASQADTLLVNGTNYRSASTSNTANTVVARDSSGNISAIVFQGIASSARYADLAEKYISDVEYEEGTVVIFGGPNEITQSIYFGDSRVAGVISAKPAYLMNEESTGLPVALRGKVPVKLVGTVSKGDLLITSDIAGHATSVGDDHSYGVKIFAKSLEDSNVAGLKTIMAVII